MEPKKLSSAVLLTLGLGACIDKPVAQPCLSMEVDDTNADDSSADDSGGDSSAQSAASKSAVIERLAAEGRLPADVAQALKR